MSKVELALRNLCIGYHRTPLPLEPLTLRLESGQTLCCLGENGRGKSTFLRTLCGLQAPIGGEVSVGGKSLWSMRIEDRSRWIAIATTDRIPLDGLSVAEVLDLNPPHAAYAQPIPRQLVIEQLLVSGIEHLPLSSLSDGQYKRVMLARCILQQTPILLLDEPFAHLDPDMSSRVKTIISSCTREFQRIILYTAHSEAGCEADDLRFHLR